MAKVIRNLFQKSPRVTKPHRPAEEGPAKTTLQTTAPTAIDQRAIEERAYFLWRDAGCPGGRDIHFWLLAEEQLRAEQGR